MGIQEPGLRLSQGHPREILRQASAALQGPVVTLWEARNDGGVDIVLASTPEPGFTASALDVDGTLRRWGIPIIPGALWLGCRRDDTGRWCLAPVRREPAAPPPNVERRSHVRMTLELAGLCVGLTAYRPGTPYIRRPDSDALAELARHPSAIAHEVASPLTASLANLGECMDAVEHEQLDDEIRAGLLENLAGIEAGLQRAVEYLRSIQSRARDALAEKERFDAVRVVHACVALERPVARKSGSELVLETMPGPLFLRGDPNGLYRILTNLLRNAVHASVGRQGVVVVKLESADHTLRLTVQDLGVGIVPEHLKQIFDAGFTTKPEGEGTGMGLAIAKDVAETMFGATITVDSTIGRGSTFTVALPLPVQRPGPTGA